MTNTKEPITTPHACRHCGALLPPNAYYTRIYCKDACKQAAFRHRRKNTLPPTYHITLTTPPQPKPDKPPKQDQPQPTTTQEPAEVEEIEV